LGKSYSRTESTLDYPNNMVLNMTENIRFIPVDLRIHRSQVIDLNVEHLSWVEKEMKERYKIDIFADTGTSVREYVTSIIEKLCSDVPPQGIYYLLELDNAIIGMGALRQVKKNIGEIKRMYIRPAYRGKGYGKALLHQLLHKAKEFGYHTIYLDSGRFMTAAQHLYRSVGFIERNEYPETEVPPQMWSQWVFMEKTLKDATK
jgi:N-acetylglutamate synthase-like GNAT family acetyltransferase